MKDDYRHMDLRSMTKDLVHKSRQVCGNGMLKGTYSAVTEFELHRH